MLSGVLGQRSAFAAGQAANVSTAWIKIVRVQKSRLKEDAAQPMGAPGQDSRALSATLSSAVAATCSHPKHAAARILFWVFLAFGTVTAAPTVVSHSATAPQSQLKHSAHFQLLLPTAACGMEGHVLIVETQTTMEGRVAMG